MGGRQRRAASLQRVTSDLGDKASTLTMNNELRVRLALIAGAYVWEASVLLIIHSLCRMEGKPDVLSFLSSVGGKLFLMASL